MTRQTLLIAALAALSCTSCGPTTPQEPPSLLPQPQAARKALEAALEGWRSDPSGDPKDQSVVFVDQQRRPGQRLREFAILGDSVVDNLRRYVVRLSLAEPDESALVAYYVFDRGPIWVYRAEDFDMMMNMDMRPSEPATAGASAPPPDRR